MWQDKLLAYARGFAHPAWGPAHCERVYSLAQWLAGGNDPADDEVLFAAAYTHDLGAFPPHRQPGVDHAERSAEVAPALLGGLGFPADKIPGVVEAIRGHMFSAEPGTSREALLLHDADTLDLLGAIGVARVLSLVGLDDWAPDLPSAVRLIDRYSRELPERLALPGARALALVRQREMTAFLTSLATETGGFSTL